MMHWLGAMLLLTARPGAAHGLWGHIHVTGWAVENMPDDELRQFLLEPEVFSAMLYGATFTDSGYALDDSAARAYAEHAHWEPFIEDFAAWIRANDPPPWDSLESRQRVGFLIGCASHGLQDSIFDSLFLYQIAEQDGAGQEEADPGTDGFLVMDDHVRFFPAPYLPMDTLLDLYAAVDPAINEALIERALALVTGAYINDGGGLVVAETIGESYVEVLPWTRTHYLDPEVPGSLRAEIYPTMRYQQAVWARLHGELTADDAAIYAFPEGPRRLRSPRSDTVDGWTSLIFGVGVRYTEDMVELLDADGAPVPFSQGNTRWGADYTRLIRLMPSADLQPGAWYTARLRAGLETIDGQTSSTPWQITFQVECDAATAEDCSEPVEFEDARIDGIPAEDTAASAAPEAPQGCGGCAVGPSPSRRRLPLLALLLPLAWACRRR